MLEVKNKSKNSMSGKITYFLMLNLGIILLTAGIYFFKAPNGFATGGVSGLSLLLAEGLSFLHINQSTYVLIINTLLLIVGALILGRQCGILTFYCSLMYSIQNFLLETFLPISIIPGAVVNAYGNYALSHSPLLELVFAIMLTGIGSAIIFRCGGSSGGTDIVALILKKYTSMNVGTALLCSDFIIAASSIFIYNTEIGLYSLLGLFAKVFVVDDILDSMNMCKSFTIITTKAAEIQDFILNTLHRGATIHDAEGSYSHEDKKVIITVCSRTEAIRLRTKAKEIDPSAFIIITKTSEIMGKGFRAV